MRIGIVSPYSLTLPGGVQAQVLGIATALRELGVDTRVLGPCDGPPPAPGVTPLGLSIPTAANGSMAPIAPDASAQLRLLRSLRDEEFDVLHLHEPMAPGPTMTAAVLKPCPMIGTFHAAGDSLAYRYLRPAVRWLAGRLALRCAVSADAEQMARAALGGRYLRLFNGIDVQRYGQAKPAETDGPTIFFVGRHEPRKGLAVLLAALAHLPSDVRLWVAGDGPETAELQRAVAGDPRVEWLGRISEADKMARLKGAHVLCAPSLRGESFGIVLLEAMAAGTPVVAADLPGYSNVARAGRDALLTPPGDPVALALALREVLEDEHRAASLVDSGLERAETFSMARLALRYVELSEHVMGLGITR